MNNAFKLIVLLTSLGVIIPQHACSANEHAPEHTTAAEHAPAAATEPATTPESTTAHSETPKTTAEPAPAAQAHEPAESTPPVEAVAVTLAPTTDIAVLIDVSGSMKQNDPHNLRIPALKLFINLLPPETKAGVWLFAEDTTLLIPSGIADAAWKAKALAAVDSIHSRGKFTNIETALTTVLQQWPNKAPTENRNILLLTDGVVDVAKDPAQNAASKDRILNEVLPNLQQTGAHLQTIALSKQADSELLQKLAFSSNGWNETVESAKQLERIFVKLFKQAVPQDAVPLVGNKFNIDASIKEFSAMVFKKPGASTELLSPDHSKLNHSSVSENLHWVNEKNFDLMTVKNPTPGEWQILGDIDPDNQVLILTDLKLNVSDTPLYKGVNEPLALTAHFSDQNQVIDRDDFLKVVTLTLQQTDSAGKTTEHPLSAAPEPKGHFQLSLKEPVAKGNYTLKLVADGKTFTREITRNIAIVDAPVTLSSSIDQAKRQVTLTLTPDAAAVDPASLTLTASILEKPKEPVTSSIEKHGETWQLTVDAPEHDAQKIINISATGKDHQGKPVEATLQPFTVDGSLFKAEEHATPTLEAHAEQKPEVKHEPVAAETPQPPPQNWLMTALITVGINIVFIALGYAGYRMLKKSAAKKQARLMEMLS